MPARACSGNKRSKRSRDDNFFRSIEKNRLRFQTVRYDGIWLDVGTPGCISRPIGTTRPREADPRANALSADVEISRRARVERSVLWENTEIGPGARLTECIVTGAIGLENAEYRGQIVSRLGVFPLL